MPRTYSVNLDLRALRNLRERVDRLAPASMARVQQRAIGTLRRRVGPEVVRLLGDDLNLPKAKIRNRITVTGGVDHVAITGSAVGIPLSEFRAKWSGPSTRGATAQVWRHGAPRTYAGSFIAQVAGKQPNVYERAWIDGRRSGRRYGRLPVQIVRGPNIGSLLIDSGPRQVAGPLITFTQQILAAELSRLLDIEAK